MKKKDIISHIHQWAASGVVNQEQASKMIADIEAAVSERSSRTFINAVMYMGATGLSLGMLLLIAANWSALSRGIQLLLVLLLPTVPFVFAYWQLQVRDGGGMVLGRAANILAVAAIGGSLALIGQIYNLDSPAFQLIGLWTVLSLPFVFVFRKIENVLLSASGIGATIFFAILELGEGRMEESVLVLLLTIAGVLYAYVLYTLGNVLRYMQEWLESGRVLRIGSVALATLVLFVTTFEGYARELLGGYSATGDGSWVGLSIVFNILFIIFLFFAIVRATRFEEYALAFGLVRFFGIYLLVKYFTLFFSMMDTGLFFVIGGLLFIASGWLLEKKKTLLLAYMKGTFDHSSENNTRV